jgi:hypothetical protein
LVRKSRWNASVFNFKYDYGPHTKAFYLSKRGDMGISDGRRKHSADAPLIQTTPQRRAPPDYKQKDWNEFKVAGNVYHTGCYNNNMEGVNVNYLSGVSSSDAIHHDRWRPVKVPNHLSTARFQ